MEIKGRKAKRVHKEPWSIHVTGHTQSPFYGPRAGDETGELNIKHLLVVPGKDTMNLLFKTLTAEVEQLIQGGRATEAADLIKEYHNTTAEYKSPYYVFQKDNQNGGAPYLGAYCYFGAFRDAAKELFPTQFYDKKKSADQRTAKILKSHIAVTPYHVFFYRDKSLKKRIGRDEIDIEDNNPTLGVRGFAFYERIFPPLHFSFTIHILTDGPFQDTLRNEDKVLKIFQYSVYKGLGAKRGQGGGLWRPDKIRIEASAEDL